MKTKKASILAVTIIIMGLVLMAALSIYLSSIKERKAAMGLNKSSQAFQRAASGVEIVFQQIKDNSGENISTIDSNCDGIIEDSIKGYKVELKDADNNIISDCNAEISSIESVKSVGTAGQNQRAIEAAVAAAVAGSSEQTCAESEDIETSYPSVVYSQTPNSDKDTLTTCPEGYYMAGIKIHHYQEGNNFRDRWTTYLHCCKFE